MSRSLLDLVEIGVFMVLGRLIELGDEALADIGGTDD